MILIYKIYYKIGEFVYNTDLNITTLCSIAPGLFM